MTTIRMLSALGVACAVGSVAGTFLSPGGRVEAQAARAVGGTGRYQMVTPPAGDSQTNFLWVLDTQTGNVRGHRFASVRGSDGKVEVWLTESLETDREYLQRTSKK